ncbi:MAG: gluconolactonase [Blastocatellia bacterium]|nr:MAG: gluconolactonase [Blastocatellia bacterium]
MSLFKRLLVLVLLIVGIGILYLLLAPVPINPAAWTPPTAPTLTGPYQQNSRLRNLQRLPLGDGHAPEDVALDAQGRIYAGFDDGRIIQLDPDGKHPHVFADTKGRPLGLIFDSNSNLIVADAITGLLSIGPNGEVRTLSTGIDGRKYGCLNDLDVAGDGTIYFTEASSKFPMKEFTSDMLEHQPNGRLLAYDPKSQTTRTVVSDLYFANGVAVSPDQSFVLVVETGTYKVRRVWLTGAKQGQSEDFISNLPGFPDGISSNGKGKFWLSLVTPRDEVFDKVLPHPFARKVIYRLPRFLQPAPKHYSFVLGLDSNGRVVDNLQNGAPDCYAEIANAVERNGALYFGSIAESTVGKFVLQNSVESH